VQVQQIGEGLYRLVDVLGDHAYLVCGNERALMVDACGGFADVAAAARELCDLPVEVAVTHTHYDHIGGTAFFGKAYVPTVEHGRWEAERALSLRVLDQLLDEGLVDEADACGPRDCAAPQELPLEEGHVFDLGGRTVRVVALPGHTHGSVGYLVEDARVLFSGDAVTPIMCLFFAESLGVDMWRSTLQRMQQLPFDHF
jgi:glyoxylase-like metal-dependent hydrolase (beta-lactamase superfamily II)